MMELFGGATVDKRMVSVLNDILKKIDKSPERKYKNEKYQKELKYLKERYEKIEVSEGAVEVYESLVKKGKELLYEANIKDPEKVGHYLRYCRAALYDMEGNIKPLNYIIRSYLISCIMFLILSPIYLDYKVALLLLIPIYMGLKGMKKRSNIGFLYGMSAMPMALLTAVIALKSEYFGLKNFNVHISQIAEQINKTPAFARNLVISAIVFSIIMLSSTVFTIIVGFKHRKMFV